MLLKTHLAITVFFVLVLINSVTSVSGKIIFVLMALISTYLPDVDSRFSSIGHRKLSRILQFFTKHRGITHSFTFLLAITFFLVLFSPLISLGFFLGYGLHLMADSFTRDGIRPFYPLKLSSKGGLKTGSRFEISIFVFFVVADLLFFAVKVFGFG